MFFPPGAARRWGAACSCNREWGCAIWVCSQSTVHQSGGDELGATLNTEVTVFFVGPTWLWMVLLRSILQAAYLELWSGGRLEKDRGKGMRLARPRITQGLTAARKIGRRERVITS